VAPNISSAGSKERTLERMERSGIHPAPALHRWRRLNDHLGGGFDDPLDARRTLTGAALTEWNDAKFAWSRFFVEAFIAIVLILSAFLPC